MKVHIWILLLAVRFVEGDETTQERPNILWITSEDNGISWVSCYGGVNVVTPAIDKLAQ